MKSLASSNVWWPDLDRQQEDWAKKCETCQAGKKQPSKAPLHLWAWPTLPWQRVHVDFAGQVMGKMLLIATDAHSKWPEVQVMSSTTTSKTIEVLRELFTRYGLPEQLVSDNGPQFVSDYFRSFLMSNEVKHSRSPLYHPATNGTAERLVQTVKQALKSGQQQGVPLKLALATFLLRYWYMQPLELPPALCSSIVPLARGWICFEGMFLSMPVHSKIARKCTMTCRAGTESSLLDKVCGFETCVEVQHGFEESDGHSGSSILPCASA